VATGEEVSSTYIAPLAIYGPIFTGGHLSHSEFTAVDSLSLSFLLLP
jgi:hypothetical protein